MKAKACASANAPGGERQGEAIRRPEGDPLRSSDAAPSPEPEPSPPRRVVVQVERPTPANPGGTIAEGVERHTDKMVRVYGTDGNLIGSAELRPGEDAATVARRLLREKHARSDFYKPLAYKPVLH
jgi:hypothetical protein